MITEDYVSFECAKLLKENGFNRYPIFSCYKEDNGEFIDIPITLDTINYYFIPAPTLQIAMKWLREVHNIFFNINYFHLDVGNKWVCLTIWLPYKNGCELSIEGFNIETIYDSAIKYCLENLI